MTDIIEFESAEAMLDYISRNREAADATVGPEAAQFTPGSHYARFMPEYGLIVYGEIIDPVQSEIDAGADEEEVEYQRELRAEPHMKHMRFTKSYSQACESGEYGDVHVSSMHLHLTKEEFERAKANEWPVSPRDLFEKVLEIALPTRGGAA